MMNQLVVGNFYDRSSGRDLDDESNPFLRYTDHGSRGHCLFTAIFLYHAQSLLQLRNRELCYCSSGLFVAARSDSVLYFNRSFMIRWRWLCPTMESVRRSRKSGQGLSQMLFSYNSQLVRDPKLIMQVLSHFLMTPIIFIVTFALSGTFDLGQMDARFCGVFFLAGIALL